MATSPVTAQMQVPVDTDKVDKADMVVDMAVNKAVDSVADVELEVLVDKPATPAAVTDTCLVSHL